jgi:hypothetical protein
MAVALKKSGDNFLLLASQAQSTQFRPAVAVIGVGSSR